MRDENWLADLDRYGSRALLREQGLWATAVYRFGRRNDQRPDSFAKRVRNRLYWLMFRASETLLGISIPKSVEIGPGLRIWHFGGIFIHERVRIGAGCTLRQGVTLGNRHQDDDVPVIGDNVEFGAYSQVLGRVRIGNGCRIGAMTLVLTDVPDGATAVGVPARIVMPRADEDGGP
ncbi:MAG: serine acetyltransferase [Burkholderiaceae bacterium]